MIRPLALLSPLQTAKAQLLLRLLRMLSSCTLNGERRQLATMEGSTHGCTTQGSKNKTPILPASSWLHLAATAAAMFSCRCEPLLLEALRLLNLVLHVCEDDTSRNVLGPVVPGSSRIRRVSSQSLSHSNTSQRADAQAEEEISGVRSGRFDPPPPGLDANGNFSRCESDVAEDIIVHGPNSEGDTRAGGGFEGSSISSPPLSHVLSHLHNVWRPSGSGGDVAPVDEHISARLLKGVSVGSEVSLECRRETLHMIETLAVCYADEIAPTNTLAIASLLGHALAVMLALPSNAVLAATGHSYGVEHGHLHSPPTALGIGAQEAAGDALHFLERNGSASFERLVDLFTEIAEGGELGDDDTVLSRQGTPQDWSSPLSSLVENSRAGRESSRARKSGLHPLVSKERSRRSLERGIPGQEAWHPSHFDERKLRAQTAREHYTSHRRNA